MISFAPGASSLGKGETIADTAITLRAIGVRVIVVRHPESGFPRRLAESFDGHIINAGDGTHAHPTQALLDLMTLRDQLRPLEGLRVAIVGDILHSRVARSNIVGMRMLGVDVTLVGPRTLLPGLVRGATACDIERDLDAVLPHVDAVMMLRIQRERIVSGLLPSLDDYTRRFQLNPTRLARLSRDAVIMHPGPVQPRRRADRRGARRSAFALRRAGAQRRLRAHGRARVSRQQRAGVGVKTVVRGGRVIDPSLGLDAVRDVVIENGFITEIVEHADTGVRAGRRRGRRDRRAGLHRHARPLARAGAHAQGNDRDRRGGGGRGRLHGGRVHAQHRARARFGDDRGRGAAAGRSGRTWRASIRSAR